MSSDKWSEVDADEIEWRITESNRQAWDLLELAWNGVHTAASKLFAFSEAFGLDREDRIALIDDATIISDDAGFALLAATGQLGMAIVLAAKESDSRGEHVPQWAREFSGEMVETLARYAERSKKPRRPKRVGPD